MILILTRTSGVALNRARTKGRNDCQSFIHLGPFWGDFGRLRRRQVDRNGYRKDQSLNETPLSSSLVTTTRSTRRTHTHTIFPRCAHPTTRIQTYLCATACAGTVSSSDAPALPPPRRTTEVARKGGLAARQLPEIPGESIADDVRACLPCMSPSRPLPHAVGYLVLRLSWARARCPHLALSALPPLVHPAHCAPSRCWTLPGSSTVADDPPPPTPFASRASRPCFAPRSLHARATNRSTRPSTKTKWAGAVPSCRTTRIPWRMPVRSPRRPRAPPRAATPKCEQHRSWRRSPSPWLRAVAGLGCSLRARLGGWVAGWRVLAPTCRWRALAMPHVADIVLCQ